MLPGPSFCVSGPSLISVTYEQLIPDTPNRTHQVCFNVMILTDDKEMCCPVLLFMSPVLL